MGMYDTVWVKCPKCGEESGFQSKSGACILENYTLENCPDDVMANVNRHSPNTCDCGAIFEVDVGTRKVVMKRHTFVEITDMAITKSITQVNDLYRLHDQQFGDVTIIFIDEEIIKFVWRKGGYDLTTTAPRLWWDETGKTKLP